LEISLDFESRSTVNLKLTGVYPYAASPHTDMLCMAYSVDGMEPMLWLPGDPVPDEFGAAHTFRAYNAQFERLIYRHIMEGRFGFPHIYNQQWRCTQAEARAMALPTAKGLLYVARVLRCVEQKDDAGHRLMLKMCKPRKPRKDEDPEALLYHEAPDQLNRLYKYCIQDVRTEQAVAGRLRRLSKKELSLYHLDQRANDRGVGLDMDLIRAGLDIRDEAVDRASARLSVLTDGACRRVTNTADLRKWLGVRSIDKAAIKELLLTETDPVRREAIQIRADAGKGSVAKMDTMLVVEHGGSAHGLLQFHGADTGRWAGRLVQPQNFPRPPKGIESFIPLVLARDYAGIDKLAPPMEVLSGLLRSMLRARGDKRFLCGDFASIEGWVVAWLAGQDGMTSYEEMASKIFNKPIDEITEEERAVGKVAVLGCGFGMGPSKYGDTVYDWTGIQISEELQVRAVETYRALNWQIKNLWREVEDAALQATMLPGKKVRCGRDGCVTFRVKGEFLWAVLPSGRPLCYPFPAVEETLTPWGQLKPSVETSTTNSYTRKWERRTQYGGLLVENLVQAIARDVMAEAMLRVEAKGYPIVLTVHDEILAEREGGELSEFMSLLAVCPNWAPGLVVKASGWEGERYRK
jgi:DNA polymerase